MVPCNVGGRDQRLKIWQNMKKHLLEFFLNMESLPVDQPLTMVSRQPLKIENLFYK